MIAAELARRAADPACAERDFLRIRQGTTTGSVPTGSVPTASVVFEPVTYREAERRAAALAAGLQRLGVRRDEPVVALMGNSVELVLLWLAVARLGAVHVPVNPALIGDGLAHAFRLTRARIAVVDDALAPQLDAVRDRLPDLQRVVRVPSSEFDELADTTGAAAPAIVEVDPVQPAVMLFTSGTTGVSKACVLSHTYVLRQGQLHAQALALTADDVLYTPFPLFHIDAATLTVVAALSVGGTAAIAPRYSTSRFWDDVRAVDASVISFMGATLTMLWQAPADPRDRDHRVRLAWGVPMPAWKAGFEARFGIPLYEVYGLTDAGVPVYDPLDAPHRTGFAGRVLDAYEVAIADPAGRLLPPGEVGEILVRGREPGLVMNGYFAMPEATERAIRHGWVHTGDLGKLSDDGWLAFLGRSGEVIRRRGENISALDIEAALQAHPDVVEAAAIGVPSEWSEEEVMVFVVRRPGSRLDGAALTAWLAERLAGHMIPRFVEFLDALPRTPTEKIAKGRLRERGRSEDTWDRESMTRLSR